MKAGGYNIMRDDIALLEEHENSPPSFSVHLYPAHWTLNNGPKFLYNNQVSSILEDIRAFRIPTDFMQLFDDAGVPYYDGCLIIELLDYRPAKAKDLILEKPDVQRVVLRPTPETLWADICMMNTKVGSVWADAQALELESKILLHTSTPLCLDPDPRLTRIVNNILRVSTPIVPNSLKRKAAAMVDLEEDETEKARRVKVLQYMNPQTNTSRKPFHPSYKILRLLEQQRANPPQQRQPTQTPNAIATASTTAAPTPQMPTPVGIAASSSTGSAQGSEIVKAPAPVIAPVIVAASSQNSGIKQPTPTTTPVQVPPAVQQVIDPMQRRTPVIRQPSTVPSPARPPSQRPLSQPIAAAPVSTQATPISTQQGQGQPIQQPTFNPPIPPPNFLNQPPVAKRRMSLVTAKPGTPATPSQPLPTQHSPAQPQMVLQTQPQTQPQIQAPQVAQQQQASRPSSIPPSMAAIQGMANFPNIALLHMQPNGRIPAVTPAAIAAAQRQAQVQSGRSTPASSMASQARNSPTPASAMARSPMMANAGAIPGVSGTIISGRNTPVTANVGSPQVARASPMVGNQQPVAAAAMATRGAVGQQQVQPQSGIAQPMQMQMLQGQPMMPTANTLAYQQQLRIQQAYVRHLQAQAQAHGAQPGAQPNTAVNQNLQNASTPGIAQDQQVPAAASVAQQFGGIQITPHMFGPLQGAMGGYQQPPHQQQQVQYPQHVQQQQHQQQYMAWLRRMHQAQMQAPGTLQGGTGAGAGRGALPATVAQMQNGQQLPIMPPGMTFQQVQGLGRGALPGNNPGR